MDFPGAGTGNSNGAWDFVGFVDPGASITSITIDAGTASLGADEIGVDDVQYQSGAVIPEPGPVFLSLTGFGLLFFAHRRHRVARALGLLAKFSG